MSEIPGLGERLLGQPEVAERARRALSIKGEMPERLEEQLSGSVTMEDLTQPEYWWLRRTMSYWRGVTVAAGGAGNFNVFSLAQSPSASVLAIVDQIVIYNSTAAIQLYRFGLSTNNAVGTSTSIDGGPLDARQQGDPLIVTGAFQIFHGVNLTAFFPLTNDGVVDVQVAANSQLFIPGAWLLTSAMNLFVSGGNANVAGGVSFRWRERSKLASEA